MYVYLSWCANLFHLPIAGVYQYFVPFTQQKLHLPHAPFRAPKNGTRDFHFHPDRDERFLCFAFSSSSSSATDTVSANVTDRRVVLAALPRIPSELMLERAEENDDDGASAALSTEERLDVLRSEFVREERDQDEREFCDERVEVRDSDGDGDVLDCATK